MKYTSYNNTSLAFTVDLNMDSSILTMPSEMQGGDTWLDDGGELLSPGDALIMSIRTKGCVDILFMSKATGLHPDEVIKKLDKSIYCNPEKWVEGTYEGWETADEYLSGNLLEKISIAKLANKEHERRFNKNISAIKSLLPRALERDEIYVTLGSPWLPESIVADFIKHLLQLGKWSNYKGVYHNLVTGSWKVDHKTSYSQNVRNRHTFGTPKLSALSIIEKTLNMIPIVIHKRKRFSSDPVEVDSRETAMALEKQTLILREFDRWIWKDEKRANEIRKIYYARFASKKPRHFDGSFLTFPGMSEAVNLYPYQKDAVARILFSPNTLLAHDVGAGKTYIMIAAAMEMKRLGIAKKSMFVVPNTITGQWMSFFKEMYPDANIMNIRPSDFTPKKRQKTLEEIRDAEDVDGIIIPYSCFDMIKLSKQSEIEALRAEKRKIMESVEIRHRTRRTSIRLNAIDKKLQKLSEPSRDNACNLSFDDLGIDRLFVDEAHNYKNVSIASSISGVLGIGGKGSEKSNSMMQKVRFMQKHHDGGGVIMATGTPITNSVSDIYVFQSYLQGGELDLLGLGTFDAWVGMFAEKTTEFEIGVTSEAYRLATRFSKFHNVPELTTLLASIADFHEMGPEAGLPEFEGYTDVIIPCNDRLKAYIQELSMRADDVHERRVKAKDDNMLKITSDSRKAALDIRLIEGTEAPAEQCKVCECASRVAEIYHASKSGRLTQLVFCDSSTPKKEFNVYDALRSELISKGVSSDEVAFVHDADTEDERQALFKAVREGRIRIIVGSTTKLGTGVNVQDRLVAIHHLDIPWRPSDMVQREGRMLRAGNLNEKVNIFRYITKESFDAYSWQILETKQKFISDLLSGTTETRSGSDVDGTALDYAEVKALAIGNPLIKSRVETSNELTRLKLLNAKEKEARLALTTRLRELPDIIDEKEIRLVSCLEDANCVDEELEYSERLLQRGMVNLIRGRKENEAFLRRNGEETIRNVFSHNLIALGMEWDVLWNYRGFKIVIPAESSKESPKLEVRRCGTYSVLLKDNSSSSSDKKDSEKKTSLRYMVRVDNVINGLRNRAERYKEELDNLKKEMIDIKKELEINHSDYSDKIDAVSKKLRQLDAEIGIKTA